MVAWVIFVFKKNPLSKAEGVWGKRSCHPLLTDREPSKHRPPTSSVTRRAVQIVIICMNFPTGGLMTSHVTVRVVTGWQTGFCWGLKGCLRSAGPRGSADTFYAALVSETARDAFLLRLGAGRRRGRSCRPLLPAQKEKPDTEAEKWEEEVWLSVCSGSDTRVFNY